MRRQISRGNPKTGQPDFGVLCHVVATLALPFPHAPRLHVNCDKRRCCSQRLQRVEAGDVVPPERAQAAGFELIVAIDIMHRVFGGWLRGFEVAERLRADGMRAKVDGGTNGRVNTVNVRPEHQGPFRAGAGALYGIQTHETAPQTEETLFSLRPTDFAKLKPLPVGLVFLSFSFLLPLPPLN